MSSLPEQTTRSGVVRDTTPIQPVPQASSRVRLFFLDHLRAALTILVVLHHLAVMYGANAAFYYLEPPKNDLVASLGLLVFVLINPLSSIGLYYWISIKTPFISLYPSLIGVGPLWFVEMLLFFCLGFVIWRLAERSSVQPSERVFGPPSYLAVGLFILALAAASYLLRIVVPLGLTIPIFGFPTLSYLPQYLSFFILGAIAFRRNWFVTIPGSMGRTGFVVALVATLVLFPLALFSSRAGAIFLGQGSWQSAVYALWDSTFSVGMCLGLITFFRRFFNGSGKLGRFLSRQAYTVYIIHIPIIVMLALAVRGIHLENLLKFALAALIAVPLCFGVAFLVRKIPFASRIL